jgi:lipopolysaccharide cholinephosphotransferase
MITEQDKINCRKIQIRMLDALNEICKKNNITYWIDFGTLLGAIRTKSFIPWDDDIDVSMPMENYKKFLKIARNQLPKDIFLQTPQTDKYYKQAMAKLRDCNSTFLEHHESGEEKYHKGIYIDIFPSVYYPKMPYFFKKVLLYLTVRTRYSAIVAKRKIIINYSIYLLCKFIWLLFSPFKSDKFAQIPEDNGYYYGIPKSNLYPLKDIEFEGKFYPAPNKIHEYLSIMYGDNYMTPPPPEKRVAHAKVILTDTPCVHPKSIIKSNE